MSSSDSTPSPSAWDDDMPPPISMFFPHETPFAPTLAQLYDGGSEGLLGRALEYAPPATFFPDLLDAMSTGPPAFGWPEPTTGCKRPPLDRTDDDERPVKAPRQTTKPSAQAARDQARQKILDGVLHGIKTLAARYGGDVKNIPAYSTRVPLIEQRMLEIDRGHMSSGDEYTEPKPMLKFYKGEPSMTHRTIIMMATVWHALASGGYLTTPDDLSWVTLRRGVLRLRQRGRIFLANSVSPVMQLIRASSHPLQENVFTFDDVLETFFRR